MQRFSNKALWFVVVAALFLAGGSQAAWAEDLYTVDFFVANTSVGAKVVSCDPEAFPLEIIAADTSVSFEEGKSLGRCKVFAASADVGADVVYLVMRVQGEDRLVRGQVERISGFTVPSELKAVLIFVGGMVATVLGRVLSLVFDPVYQAIRVHWEFRGLKSFLMSVSDTFEYDLKVSEDLWSISKGSEMTNFLIFPSFRRRTFELVALVEDWKAHRCAGEELRARLAKI